MRTGSTQQPPRARAVSSRQRTVFYEGNDGSMYKWIKKNQRKMLAIFSVLLMIAFLATLGPGTLSGRGGRSEVVVGHVNGKPLYDRELQAGKDQWQILM